MMSPLDSKILDINSEALGVTVDELMDNAGRAVADVISNEFPEKGVLFVCGTGNNGGDGLAAAYHLGYGSIALLHSADRIKTDASRKRYDMLRKKPQKFSSVDIDEYDVIVDCVLGVGLSGELRPDVAEYVQRISSFQGTVISVDVPTGFGSDTAVRPDMTITFHDIKEGMDENNCGTIVIADIGIPKDASEFIGPGDMLRYPVSDPNSHKGQNGRVLVIGGGPYVGAPAMAGMAALRTGADIVTIATPRKSFIQISSMSPSLIVRELSRDLLSDDDVPYLIELSSSFDAVLIGPGLGNSVGTSTAVASFLRSCETPMVIDADAISSLPDIVLKAPAVITPHSGELLRILKENESLDECARRINATIVSKGKTDIATDGTSSRKNSSGTPGMTVGGTGDVLAGIITGLLSKGMSTFDAACLGAYISGKAGEIAFSDMSYGMMATDVIESIPKVLKEHVR